MLKHLVKPNIVIQGASRGIGKALLVLLRQRYPQANLVATARSTADFDIYSSPLFKAFPLNLGSGESIAQCAKSIKTHLPTINLLINVSGLLHDETNGIKPEKRLNDLDYEACTKVFQTNCIGPSTFISQLLSHLPQKEIAVIANITARVGSIADNRLGGWYSYRASKAAMNMITKTLAIELNRVRKMACAVALHPGTTDTNLSKPFQKNVPKETLFSPERSADQLMNIIENLSPQDSGRFIAWDGSDIPW